MQGKTINGFELKSLLGRGGMAEVWYAENEIGKPAAVKILNEDLSHNAQIVDRFRNEAVIMVKLDHPNIRQVYGYGVLDGRPCIIMEYLEGEDLKARMKRGQRFTDDKLQLWWNQLVAALNYTHQKCIVHRDIKPGNIFVDKEDNIKLLDFGIAKVRESISSTQTGQKLGTLMYMSPEQVKDSKHIDYRTDIYSLAVTFVHLITGKKPYDSDTSSDFEISEQIVYKSLDLSALPENWTGFIAPYLEKDPAKRPALRPFEAVPQMPLTDEDEGTIVEGAHKISSSERPNPSSKTSHDGRRIESSLLPNSTDKPKSKKGLWIAIGAAAVAAIAAILFLRQPKQEPVPIDPETEAFLACQTVADYQAFCDYYGMRAAHYAEAQRKVDSLVTDSLQRAEAEAIELALQGEETAYQGCNTLAGCNAYLQAYPLGRYVDNVKQKKAELEDDEAYAVCNTIAACEAYLRKYPQGRHVAEVQKKLGELTAAVAQNVAQNNNQQSLPVQAPQYPPQTNPQPKPSPTPEATSQSLTGTANGHEWVDLDLPSGTLWATCNVGATSPEGYGNYYAWGETSSKSTYNWENYRYASGNYDKLTKYCNLSKYGNNGFTDNLTTLQSGDDPASANWGSGWRTPSNSQWYELRNNTTQQWTNRGGKNGMLFTSKKNGQSIFLPAAGFRWGSELSNAGSAGLYRSSTLFMDNPSNAWRFYFNSNDSRMNNDNRNNGQPVRPVRSSR